MTKHDSQARKLQPPPAESLPGSTPAPSLVPVPSAPSVAHYDIDPGHTEVGFRVRHMMVSWTRGRFTRFSGSVTWDEEAPERSRIDVSIDAASVDTQLAQRDEHLRSEDFLHVEKYPQLTFRSTGVERAGEPGRFRVPGELTVRGVTRPVVLDVQAVGAEVKDPWGGIRRGASATATLHRRDFGLHWNALLEAGGVAVGDEVHLTLEVELLRKG